MACLDLFSASHFDTGLSGIVIGSEKYGDEIFLSYDLRKINQLAEELDNPDYLRRYFPAAAQVADAQLREIVLRKLQKEMFTVCAIRHVFVDAKVVNGVLTTPGFDWSIFTSLY